MSESTSNRAPLISVLGIFVLFALFLGLVAYFYLPRQTGEFVGDGIRTPEQRKKNLADLRAKQSAQLASYAWVDQKAGIVQLPIDVAMQLTLAHYAKR